MATTHKLDKTHFIKTFLAPLCPLTDEDIEMLVPVVEIQTLQRGDTLLAEGQIARYVTLITEGLLRTHIRDGRKDHTQQFATKDDIIIPAESLFSQEPSHKIITALNETVCLNLKYEDLLALSIDNPTFHRLLILLYQAALLREQSVADSKHLKSAQERYRHFCKNHPAAAMYANVSHVASFLNMAPETLSRLRSTVLL